MSEESNARLGRLGRRLAVVALTVGVVGIALATVRVAAEWRTVAAPLGTAPVGMDTIAAQAAAEHDRAGTLASRLDDTATQVADLQAVLGAANENVTGDTGNASALQHQLDVSAKRLRMLQGQLKSAQARLAQLNAAADRQAALNAAARSAGAAATRSSGGGGGEGGEPDDH